MKLYIGENLKKLRAEKNVTQDALAEYLGVSYQAVSRWENGLAYPDIELLPEIARYFEVSLEELLGTKSNEEKIKNTLSECWDLLCEDKKPEALAKLHQLEKEYPNDWSIKMEICNVLVAEREAPFDDVLPELRRYAFAAREEMKDYWVMKYIAESMLMAVPEEEVNEWLQYVDNSLWSSKYRILYNRYLLRNDTEKAAEQESKMLIENIEILTHFHNMTGTAEGNIAPSSMGLRLIDALVGIPYCKNDRVENSILLGRRVNLQMWLAFGYAGSGDTERGIMELEKAADLCLMYCDALKDEYFTSEYANLVPLKNDVEDKFATINWMIEDMTLEHGCEWFDSIRNDPRFKAQLERLRTKKSELEQYYNSHA